MSSNNSRASYQNKSEKTIMEMLVNNNTLSLSQKFTRVVELNQMDFFQSRKGFEACWECIKANSENCQPSLDVEPKESTHEIKEFCNNMIASISSAPSSVGDNEEGGWLAQQPLTTISQELLEFYLGAPPLGIRTAVHPNESIVLITKVFGQAEIEGLKVGDEITSINENGFPESMEDGCGDISSALFKSSIQAHNFNTAKLCLGVRRSSKVPSDLSSSSLNDLDDMGISMFKTSPPGNSHTSNAEGNGSKNLEFVPAPHPPRRIDL